jgi:flagellar assembly factor FliW
MKQYKKVAVMKIRTTRFGEINVDENNLIYFANGLIGFENLRQFCTLNREHNNYFWWLQSVENGDIAFLITEPHNLTPNYDPTLTREDLRTIQADDVNELEFGVILTVPDDPRETTANLLAPIAFNMSKNVASQIVLKDQSYPFRHPIVQPIAVGNSRGGSEC